VFCIGFPPWSNSTSKSLELGDDVPEGATLIYKRERLMVKRTDKRVDKSKEILDTVQSITRTSVGTLADAQNWLGDRGVYKDSEDLLVYKDWVIVLHRDFMDMNCYHVDWNNLYAEPWDDLKLPVDIVFPKERPTFAQAIKNVKIIAPAMDKMIKEYNEYVATL